MTESIIPFPRAKAPEHLLCETKDGLFPFSSAWCDRNRPLFDVALELLSASENDFHQRVKLADDAEGTVMLRLLVEEIDELHSSILDIGGALNAASERIASIFQDGR